MRAFCAVVRASFISQYVYRTTLIMRLVGFCVTLAFYALLWRAFLADMPTSSLETFPTLITYVCIAFIIGCLYDYPTDLIVAGWVRDGSIAYPLSRPLNFVSYFHAFAAGKWLAFFQYYVLVLWLASWLVFPLQGLTTVSVLLGVLSLLLGFCVMQGIDLLCCAVIIRLKEPGGAYNVKRFGFLLISGGIVPLDLLPWGLGNLLRHLPFSSVIYVPTAIFTSRAPLSQVPVMLLEQLVWASLLGVASVAAWTSVRKHGEIQGG